MWSVSEAFDSQSFLSLLCVWHGKAFIHRRPSLLHFEGTVKSAHDRWICSTTQLQRTADLKRHTVAKCLSFRRFVRQRQNAACFSLRWAKLPASPSLIVILLQYTAPWTAVNSPNDGQKMLFPICQTYNTMYFYRNSPIFPRVSETYSLPLLPYYIKKRLPNSSFIYMYRFCLSIIMFIYLPLLKHHIAILAPSFELPTVTHPPRAQCVCFLFLADSL